jgi:hypothetical protein
MTITQRNLSVETYRPPQDLVSGVAGGRLVGGNPGGVSGLTNRQYGAGCEQAVRTEKKSSRSLVNTKPRKATVYLMREVNRSTYEIRMGGSSSGVHGVEGLDSGVGEHGRSSPACPPDVLGDRQDGSYKGNRKGQPSREEVRQGNSSVDRWDSKTQRERRPLALAVLSMRERIGDCR